MSEMSRVAATPDVSTGVAASSSPTPCILAGVDGAVAPGGSGPAAILDPTFEGEVRGAQITAGFADSGLDYPTATARSLPASSSDPISEAVQGGRVDPPAAVLEPSDEKTPPGTDLHGLGPATVSDPMQLGSGAKVPAHSTGRHDGNAAPASRARDTVQPTSTPAVGPEMSRSSRDLPTNPDPTSVSDATSPGEVAGPIGDRGAHASPGGSTSTRWPLLDDATWLATRATDVKVRGGIL